MKEPITKSDLGRLERLVSDARDVSILAFTVAALVLGFTIWTLGSYQGEITDYAPIAFSLSLLQTMLAIGAFAGFWMIRGVAINKAKEVAEKEAKSTVDEHLKKNHKREVNNALATLFDTEYGKQMLVGALTEPSVVASIVAAAKNMGLDLDSSAADIEPISNPGKDTDKSKQNINELHPEFWQGIADKDKKRFLKPYEEPPFEE